MTTEFVWCFKVIHFCNMNETKMIIMTHLESVLVIYYICTFCNVVDIKVTFYLCMNMFICFWGYNIGNKLPWYTWKLCFKQLEKVKISYTVVHLSLLAVLLECKGKFSGCWMGEVHRSLDLMSLDIYWWK